MNKHLRTYIRQQRERKEVRLGPLSEMIGCGNLNNGARIILPFEREGVVSDDLLAKVIHALELDEDEIDRAVKKDWAESEVWVSEAVEMWMLVRLIAAVNCLHPLPEEITLPEEAEAYARNFARENHLSVCLALNRRESVPIGDAGEIRCRTFAKPGLSNIPYATLDLHPDL